MLFLVYPFIASLRLCAKIDLKDLAETDKAVSRKAAKLAKRIIKPNI